MAKRLNIGDCFVLRIPGDKYAYCQYVDWNDQMGQVIRVFDKLTDAPLTSAAELATAGELFPPVFVGLNASVKSGRWKPIGNLPVQGFRLPLFRATSALKPGTHDNWWLWDGRKERFVGKLSPEQRQLEIRLVWGDELLEERIATGENPFAKVQ